MIILIQFCAYIVLCSWWRLCPAGRWLDSSFGEEAVVTHTALPPLCEQSILVCVKVGLCEFLRIVPYGPSVQGTPVQGHLSACDLLELSGKLPQLCLRLVWGC